MDKSILIVDDHKKLRENLYDVLLSKGYEVIETSDGNRALQYLELHKVDVVITDLLMPNMDGLELSNKIKVFDPRIKVIGMSGGGDVIHKDNLKGMGKILFDGYLEKPIEINTLIEHIESN